MDSTEWMRKGNCTSGGMGAFVDVFFLDTGRSSAPAKTMCKGCVVTQQCLGYALQNGIKYGIWGGLTERERRKLLRERGGAYVVRRSTQDLGQTAQAS